MKEYFITCDVQGPISVRILANSLEEVLEQIKVNGQKWIDDSRTDAKDTFIDLDFDDSWEDYSPGDIQWTIDIMENLGYQNIHDSDIPGDWVVWAESI